jgi:hypothetical protein
MDPLQRDPGGFGQVIQVKEDEESLRAEECDGDEPEKGVRVYDGIEGIAYHGSGSQIKAGKDVGLPGRVCMELISPSG